MYSMDNNGKAPKVPFLNQLVDAITIRAVIFCKPMLPTSLGLLTAHGTKQLSGFVASHLLDAALLMVAFYHLVAVYILRHCSDGILHAWWNAPSHIFSHFATHVKFYHHSAMHPKNKRKSSTMQHSKDESSMRDISVIRTSVRDSSERKNFYRFSWIFLENVKTFPWVYEIFWEWIHPLKKQSQARKVASLWFCCKPDHFLRGFVAALFSYMTQWPSSRDFSAKS